MSPKTLYVGSISTPVESVTDPIRQVRIRNPPSEDFVAWGTAAFPTGTNYARILSIPRIEQRIDIRKIGQMEGMDLMEWATLVPGGTTSLTLQLVRGPRFLDPNPPPLFNQVIVNTVLALNNAKLVFEGHGGVTEEFSLSGPDLDSYRAGRFWMTSFAKFTSVNFGGVQWWFDLKAKSRFLYLTINWHCGYPRDEFLFRSLKLVTHPSIRWVSVLPDPAREEASQYLVKPGNHMLGKRWERSFRVILFRAGTAPPSVTYERGLGMADWSEGGFLPQGIAFPDLSHIGNLDTNVLTTWGQEGSRLNLAQADPNWGVPPLNFAYPATGSKYGGTSGTLEIENYYGTRASASALGEAMLSMMANQLRWRCRHPGAIYCDMLDGDPINIGDPVTPEANLESDGDAPWLITDRNAWSPIVFPASNPHPNDKDLPWRFRNFLGRPGADPTLHAGPVGPRDYLLTNASDENPSGFEPVDNQHQIRTLRANIALAWLAADPLALQYLTVDAELGRMWLWHGTGEAALLMIPGTPDIGIDYGRAHWWVGYSVAAAAVFHWDDSRRANYLAWATKFVQACEKAQMPSGLIGALNTGKAANAPPFGDNSDPADYWVYQAFEETYLMTALRSLSVVFGDGAFALPAGRLVSEILADQGRGLDELAWHTLADGQTVNGTGPWFRYPVGPAAPPGTRYTDRGDFVPPNICVVDPEGDPGYNNTNDAFAVGEAIGLAMLAGRNVDAMLMRWTATTSVAAALQAIRSWALKAPSAQTGAPIEVWLSALAALDD